MATSQKSDFVTSREAALPGSGTILGMPGIPGRPTEEETVAAKSKASARHAAEPPPADSVYTYLMEGDACSFQIPIEKIPLVVGKQGKKITALQEHHGVKITLPGREEEGVGTIKITGRAVDAAMKAIIEAAGPVQELKVLENDESRVVEVEGKAGPGGVSFTINPEKGSVIIGKGGATIKVRQPTAMRVGRSREAWRFHLHTR